MAAPIFVFSDFSACLRICRVLLDEFFIEAPPQTSSYESIWAGSYLWNDYSLKPLKKSFDWECSHCLDTLVETLDKMMMEDAAPDGRVLCQEGTITTTTSSETLRGQPLAPSDNDDVRFKFDDDPVGIDDPFHHGMTSDRGGCTNTSCGNHWNCCNCDEHSNDKPSVKEIDWSPRQYDRLVNHLVSNTIVEMSHNDCNDDADRPPQARIPTWDQLRLLIQELRAQCATEQSSCTKHSCGKTMASDNQSGFCLSPARAVACC